MNNYMKDMESYLDNLSFNYKHSGKWVLIWINIILTRILGLFTLTLFVIWILYLISFIFNLLSPILTLVQLWLCKRLVDLNCYTLLYYFNPQHDKVFYYAFDQGRVRICLILRPDNDIDYSISFALYNDKILYFKNALSFIHYSKIISLYCHMNRYQHYNIKLPFNFNIPLNYNQDAIKIIIDHLLKNYTIKLFLNQLPYELNDVKPIIYNYYLELLIND